MAHQAGTATDRFDLINKLRLFAEPLGWVTDDLRTAAEGVTGYWFFHNPAATAFYAVYMHAESDALGKCIDIVGNTGYTAGLGAEAQPGGGVFSARTNLYVEPYLGYDFFGTTQYLHVVVQMTAGRFRHFGVGTINNKTGYSGGQYEYCTALAGPHFADPPPEETIPSGSGGGGWMLPMGSVGYNSNFSSSPFNLPYWRSGQLRLDGRVHHFMNGGFGDQIPPTGNRVAGPGDGHILAGGFTSKHPDCGLIRNSRSQFGQLVNLTPFNLYVEFPDAGWRLVGHPSDIAVCRMTAIGAKDILNIAGEDWMIIPALQYQPTNAIEAPAGQETSWDLGYAYRMVT